MQSAPGICSSSPSDLHRYEALLQMAGLMVRHENLPDLLHEMAQRLQKVADFQFLNFSLHNPERNVMELHYWEGELAPGTPIEVSVQDSASGWVWQGQVPLRFRDLHQETSFAIALEPLKAKGFRTYYLRPLSTSERRLGA